WRCAAEKWPGRLRNPRGAGTRNEPPGVAGWQVAEYARMQGPRAPVRDQWRHFDGIWHQTGLTNCCSSRFFISLVYFVALCAKHYDTMQEVCPALCHHE